jgi:hypothetical protein
MRKAFLEFLATEKTIPEETLEDLRGLLRSAPEPIGTIAFSYGMITGGDIDLVLDEQRRHHRPFGEIAMSMGMLTKEQVKALLEVQRMRGAAHTAEALILANLCPVEEVTRKLGEFFSREGAMHALPTP